jgi:hypothetical protein
MDEETARFLLNQYWTAHHATFESEGRTYFGYPWTGTGWTYDWDPQSTTHVGASEFIVKKGTVATNVRSLTPAEFCSAPEPPMRVAEVAHSVLPARISGP